ncbi:hypothetical protein SLA2020_464710 [Shorea laevis]
MSYSSDWQHFLEAINSQMDEVTILITHLGHLKQLQQYKERQLIRIDQILLQRYKHLQQYKMCKRMVIFFSCLLVNKLNNEKHLPRSINFTNGSSVILSRGFE